MIMRTTSNRQSVSSRLCVLAALSVTLPYLIGLSPNPADSSSTSIEFALGKGSYSEIHRDCSGKVLSVTDYPYLDGGVAIDHNIPPARIGLKAGFVNESAGQLSAGEESYTASAGGRNLYYVNPDVGIHQDWFGLDCGIAVFSGDLMETGYSYSSDGTRMLPSVRLRLGYPDGVHFSTSFADNMPIVSGGGLIDAGFGFPLSTPGSNLWLGLGALPYEGLGLTLKGDFPISQSFAVRPGAHLRMGDATEYGLSLSGKIFF